MSQRPLSKELLKIIYETSQSDSTNLQGKIDAIQEKKKKDFEFYLRAVNLRLGKT